jgi:hypothetical protein
MLAYSAGIGVVATCTMRSTSCYQSALSVSSSRGGCCPLRWTLPQNPPTRSHGTSSSNCRHSKLKSFNDTEHTGQRRVLKPPGLDRAQGAVTHSVSHRWGWAPGALRSSRKQSEWMKCPHRMACAVRRESNRNSMQTGQFCRMPPSKHM